MYKLAGMCLIFSMLFSSNARAHSANYDGEFFDHYSGAFCVPSFHDGSNLVVGSWGYVRNDGSSSQYTRCPIKKPSRAKNFVVVVDTGYFGGRKVRGGDYVRCSLNSMVDTSRQSSTTELTYAEGEKLTLVMTADPEALGHSYNLSCRLPARGTIWMYAVRWSY